jgi:hypothetical protein
MGTLGLATALPTAEPLLPGALWWDAPAPVYNHKRIILGLVGWKLQGWSDGARLLCVGCLSFGLGVEWQVAPAKGQWPRLVAVQVRPGFGRYRCLWRRAATLTVSAVVAATAAILYNEEGK